MKKFFSIYLFLFIFHLHTVKLNAQTQPQFMFATGGGTFTGIGDLKVLKDDRILSIAFTYDSMGIDKYSKESDFLEKVAKKFIKDSVGYKKWIEEWNSNKHNFFEPEFIQALNNELNNFGVNAILKTVDAKLTVLVSTTWIHIGWSSSLDVGTAGIIGSSIANNESEVQLKLFIYEGDNQNKRIAEFSATGFFGSEKDFSTTSGKRIASAYAKAGKEIGKFLCKRVYKKK